MKESPKGFTSASFKSGAFKDAAFAVIDGLEQHESVLLLETDKGWSRTDVRAWSRHIGDPGCLQATSALFEDVTFAKTSTGQDVALMRLVAREVRWGQMDAQVSGADTTESVYACRADAAGTVACEGPKTLGTAHEPLPPSWTPGDGRFFAIDPATIPWTTRKKASIGPAGDLRSE